MSPEPRDRSKRCPQCGTSFTPKPTYPAQICCTRECAYVYRNMADLPAAVIDARFAAALREVKAAGTFKLDPNARKDSRDYPVRLGVKR